jgi:hypothetical protein
MKIIKGLAIFSFFSLLLGSCFDPPEFPNTPEIVFENTVFVETPDVGGSQPDSLILYIKFKDGDGDLGLPSHGTISDPFHPLNFYAGTKHTSAASDLRILGTIAAPVGDGLSGLRRKYALINDASRGASGQLVTFDLRAQPAFSALPAYVAPFKCLNYNIDTVAVIKEDVGLINNTYNIIDTVTISNKDNNNPYDSVFYYVADTFYVAPNPNYYNIEVDFFILDPSHPDANAEGFYEFDWRKYSPDPNTCGQTYDSRFPVLSESSTALDGTLTYSMRSIGFRKIFGTNIIRLRVQIKDRALHLSNSVTTPPFTLDEIRKK